MVLLQAQTVTTVTTGITTVTLETVINAIVMLNMN